MKKSLLLALLFLTFCFAESLLAGSAPLNDWKPYAQREALEPEFDQEEESGTLILRSSGSFRCNGSWRRVYAIEENQFYGFEVEYRAERVALIRRSVLVKVDWIGADGRRVGYPDYPSNLVDRGSGWQRLSEVIRAPEGATAAQVDLILRWDSEGEVRWRNASFQSAAPPAQRKVKLATVNHRPQSSTGPRQNLEEFSRFVEMAADKGADIVCLPEGVTIVGTGKTYLEVAEPVPGPSTKFLGALAKRRSVNILAGLIERDGKTCYNIAVLIGRDGSFVGKYRKVSLPREEIEGGLTPGSEFPVFDLDFGRVGILICWDIQFPEGARRLADRGAEVILLPIWGGQEALYTARSIENQVYLVTSSYDSTTGIWSPKGELLSEATDSGSIAVTEVDLAAETYWEWLGNLRWRIPRESPPVGESRP